MLAEMVDHTFELDMYPTPLTVRLYCRISWLNWSVTPERNAPPNVRIVSTNLTAVLILFIITRRKMTRSE